MGDGSHNRVSFGWCISMRAMLLFLICIRILRTQLCFVLQFDEVFFQYIQPCLKYLAPFTHRLRTGDLVQEWFHRQCDQVSTCSLTVGCAEEQRLAYLDEWRGGRSSRSRSRIGRHTGRSRGRTSLSGGLRCRRRDDTG